MYHFKCLDILTRNAKSLKYNSRLERDIINVTLLCSLESRLTISLCRALLSDVIAPDILSFYFISQAAMKFSFTITGPRISSLKSQWVLALKGLTIYRYTMNNVQYSWLWLRKVVKMVDKFSLCNIFHWALFNWFGTGQDACVWHVLLWIVDGCWFGRVHSRSPCIGRLFCCVKLYNFWPGDHAARPPNTTVTPYTIRLKMKSLLLWAMTKGTVLFNCLLNWFIGKSL